MNPNKNQFDYNKALQRLEEIAQTVEDPAVGIDDIAKLIKESDKIVEECKNYLRSARGDYRTDARNDGNDE